MPTDANLKDLFFEATALLPEERSDFLAELAKRSPEMGRRLQALVRAHERAEEASEAAKRTIEDVPAQGLDLPAIIGNYRLLECIAEGGSGVVYRARQIDLNRTVAMKLLRSGLLATGEEVQRFRVEAEVSALLDHPSIVPVYEVGNHEGRHFISMKLIDGLSLDRCKENYSSDPRSAADLIAQIARALDHGHRHGVLHRDVKPSNILLDQEGVPYLVDFGTAKLIDGASWQNQTETLIQNQTLPGSILGTPSYMAPEQARGEVVTVATDVYGLGCVLYELLTGRPPVVAPGLLETLRQVNEETPAAVRAVRPEIHRDLETICHKCLAKEQERRYGSALALAQDLERWLAYEPIEARRATRVERALLAWRRSPLVTSLIAAVALLAVALAVGTPVASFELRSSIARTRQAEEFAREQLRNAYLAEARALRHGGRAGRREEALELLGLAAAIRPGRDLLDEGASILALSDIASERSWAPAAATSWSALSFDGAFERYFTSRMDGELEVRSATDGGLLLSLEGDGIPVWRARFSANGRYLGLVHHERASPAGARTVVWDLEGPVRILDVPRLPEGHFDFAPDRPALALCWPGGDIREVDLETMEERVLIDVAPRSQPIQIRYSSAGDRMAVAWGGTSAVGIYTATGEPVTELTVDDEQVRTLSWGPEGRRLLAGCDSHRAYVWDVAGSERIATLDGHQAEVVGSAFPRRDVAVTCSWDGTTRLWNVESGETLAITNEILHDSPPAVGRLGLSTASQIRVGTIVHGGILRELRGHERKDPTSIAIDATNTFLTSGGETEVLLWDLASGERLDHLHVESLLDQLFLPNGSLILASREGLMRSRVEDGMFQGAPERIHAESTRQLAISADGGMLAFLSETTLHIRSLDERRPPLQVNVPSAMVRLTFSADGGLIAGGSYRGSGVRVFSTADGTEVAHLAANEGSCSPRFSPDGRWLAYGTNHEYHVHEVDTWKRVYSTTRNDSPQGSAKVTCYSPDSQLLVGIYGQSSLMLMEASTGEPLVMFEPPGRQIFSMGRFTSDGRYLMVSSESNRTLVWDLERLRQELALAGLDAGLGKGWTRAISREGNRGK